MITGISTGATLSTTAEQQTKIILLHVPYKSNTFASHIPQSASTVCYSSSNKLLYTSSSKTPDPVLTVDSSQ